MADVQISKIQLRRGLAQDLPGAPLSLNPVTFTIGLDVGELGMTTDTGRLYVGSDTSVAASVSYNRTSYPYTNIEVLTENSYPVLADMMDSYTRLIETGYQESVALGYNTGWTTVLLPAVGTAPVPMVLHAPDLMQSGVNTQIAYFLFVGNVALRNGRMETVWDASASSPLLVDDIVSDRRHVFDVGQDTTDPNLVYGTVTFRAARVTLGGGDAIVLQYRNLSATVSPTLLFRVERPDPTMHGAQERDPANIGPEDGVLQPAGFGAEMPITPTNGIAASYFGASSYPTKSGLRLNEGRINVEGAPRGWGNASCLMTLAGNWADQPNWNLSGAGMGEFWDFSYRRNYAGQDSQILGMANSGPAPLATVSNVTFSTQTITNLAGQPQTVYKVSFPSALSASQVAHVAHPMRVQTNNGFFGYIIPPGLSDPSTGNPVPGVDPLGHWILVDNWTHATDGRALSALPAGYGPDVLPSNYGVTPDVTTPLGSYSVQIDVVTQIQDGYYTLQISDQDTVNVAHVEEMVLLNNRAAAPTLNDANPMADAPFLTTTWTTAQTAQSSGVGTWGNGHYVKAGVQRAFVAHNGTQDSTYQRKGFFAVDPYWGFYSVQTTGYVLGVNPGNAGTYKVTIDTAGNANFRGNLRAGNGLTLDSLPTSPSGLTSGMVWRSGNTLMIV